MSRLRHLGWDRCSYGLTSRPLESCHRGCLQAICLVFRGIPRVLQRSFWMERLSSATAQRFLQARPGHMLRRGSWMEWRAQSRRETLTACMDMRDAHKSNLSHDEVCKS